MNLVFCSDPLHPRQVDPAFEVEAQAAAALGIAHALISYEALVDDNDAARAVRRVPDAPARTIAIYRGWMLKPAAYQCLYDALQTKGVTLINNPTAYRHCHYLPESYALIEGYTPRSVWLKTGADVAMDLVMELLRPFGGGPVVVKDFVKSRKHEWAEACFIPSAVDRAGVERVVRRFLELQGDDLNEGLVFREFVEFEALGRHSRSGMPLTREYRLFVLDGKILFATPYWEEGDYGDAQPPIDLFKAPAATVQSRFFSMDVARRKDGRWMIVELGDGQVAGLAEHVDTRGFYEILQANWRD